MVFQRTAYIVATVVGLLCAPGLTFAEDAISAPAAKTIGTPSTAKTEMVPSLIVMNSRTASRILAVVAVGQPLYCRCLTDAATGLMPSASSTGRCLP
jgi:hypothetical protein